MALGMPDRSRGGRRRTAVGSWDARSYEARGGFVWKLGAELVELLAPKQGERILDLGCGTGHLSARIAGAGAEVLGIDASSSMVGRARLNFPHLRFEVLDATQMTFTSQFDAVFSNAALHWMTTPAQVAAKIDAALKPGGRFVAELGGEGNISRITSSIHRARRQVGVAALESSPWYFPSAEEYTSLLEAQGLTVTLAHLFERPTPFEGGERGMRDWLALFPRPLMAGLSGPRLREVVRLVEEELQPAMFRDGTWVGDYVRLRVRAIKG